MALLLRKTPMSVPIEALFLNEKVFTMKPFTSVLLPTGRRLLVGAVAVVFYVLLVPPVADAQVPPPIDGITGTVALDSTLVQEQVAANTFIVKTMDGVEHLWHLTKDLFVQGGKDRPVDSLQGLRDGTTVVVHDTIAESHAAVLEIEQIGNEEVTVTEGTVIRIDRDRRHITIRFDNGQDERLQLTTRPALETGTEIVGAAKGTDRVTVYYADEAGQRVGHLFQKVS